MVIPTFSLSEIRSGLRQDELRKCVSEMGLFYLSDYGFDDTVHRKVTDTTVDFFKNSTAEQRMSVSISDGSRRRGFSGLGTESTASSTGRGKYSDYAMCYSMGVSDNLFPSEDFEEMWKDYFDRLYGVARETAKALLLATGAYEGSVQKIDELLDCDPVLRIRYFPEVPEERMAEKVPMRMAPHYDLSIVTLIQQFSCPNGFVSLHARVNGEVVALPEIPNTILIMCGSVASVITKGLTHTLIHHVAAPSANQIQGSDRTSSVLFLRPKADFAFSTSDARKYGLDVSIEKESATFGEWMGGNYLEMLSLTEEA